MPQPPRGYRDREINRYSDTPLANRITSGTSPMGKVLLASGSVAVDVAYTGLTSSDIFTSLVPVIASISAIASRATFLAVSSMVPGTGFTIAWGNGVAYSCDTIVHWTIGKTA